MRRIHKISTAAALAISLGAAVSGTIAAPVAQAQTVTMSLAKPALASAAPAAKATKPLVGVNLYVNENYSLADVKAWGERDLVYLRDRLGLKSVAIDWDYNVPGIHASVVKASATRTPSIEDITALTNIAKGLGMRVEYRALFAVNNSDSRDGSIAPKHFAKWLDWLLDTETPALKLAQEEKVPEFIVGTEMAAIDTSVKWASFFNKAAKIYTGNLSYASYGGHTNTDGGFFSKSRVELPNDSVSDLGTTAYPAVDLPKGASVAELTKAWETYLTKHTPKSVLKRTAIDEIGIPALANSYENPWQWNNLTGTADPTIQANWFKAACNAVTAEHMRGIYFWSFTLNNDPAKPFESLVGFLGRSASLAAIKNC
jgi:hypothetical protein